MDGRKQLLNPHKDNARYLEGDLQTLLDNTDIRKRIEKHSNRITVVAHSTGHGTEDDLALLKNDLEKEGFIVDVVHQ